MNTRFEKVELAEEVMESRFKKNWSEFEIMGVEAFLVEWFEEYGYEDLGKYLQLAYTSSSDYAMLNECGNFEFNEEIVSYFSMMENGILVMACHDEEDNYTYYYMN